MRQVERHGHGAGGVGPPENTEALEPDPEDVRREDRQQGLRPAEQDREQIQGDGAHEHRLAAHEANPLPQGFPEWFAGRAPPGAVCPEGRQDPIASSSTAAPRPAPGR